MATYNLAMASRVLYESRLVLFTTKTLRDLFGSDLPQATFFSLLARLVRAGALRRLERDKYMLFSGAAHDFQIANFLYEPSCVSLETALNFHGLLPQFPYEIASVTPRKPVIKTLEGKTYRYVHLKQSLFWGYDAVAGFLIAHPEKALLDLLYLQSKGLARVDMDEMDFSKLDRARFNAYAARFPPLKGLPRL